MPSGCACLGCSHDGRRSRCSLLTFPNDAIRKNRWIRLCKRNSKDLPKDPRLCSCHFKDHQKRNGPTIFKWTIARHFENPDPGSTLGPRERKKNPKYESRPNMTSNMSEKKEPSIFAKNKCNKGSSCCVPLCHNSSGDDKRKGVARSYYGWPLKNPQKLTLWLNSVPRANWFPKKTDYICSDHFQGGKKSNIVGSTGYIPTIFKTLDEAKKRELLKRFATTSSETGVDSGGNKKIKIETETHAPPDYIPKEELNELRGKQIQSIQPEQISKVNEIVQLSSQPDNPKAREELLKLSLSNLSDARNVINEKNRELLELRKKFNELLKENALLKSRVLFVDGVSEDNMFSDWTGLRSREHFDGVSYFLRARGGDKLTFQKSHKTTLVNSIQSDNEFDDRLFLLLVKLNTGLSDAQLGKMVGMPETRVKTSNNHVTTFIKRLLKRLFDPDRKQSPTDETGTPVVNPSERTIRTMKTISKMMNKSSTCKMSNQKKFLVTQYPGHNNAKRMKHKLTKRKQNVPETLYTQADWAGENPATYQMQNTLASDSVLVHFSKEQVPTETDLALDCIKIEPLSPRKFSQESSEHAQLVSLKQEEASRSPESYMDHNNPDHDYCRPNTFASGSSGINEQASDISSDDTALDDLLGAHPFNRSPLNESQYNSENKDSPDIPALTTVAKIEKNDDPSNRDDCHSVISIPKSWSFGKQSDDYHVPVSTSDNLLSHMDTGIFGLSSADDFTANTLSDDTSSDIIQNNMANVNSRTNITTQDNSQGGADIHNTVTKCEPGEMGEISFEPINDLSDSDSEWSRDSFENANESDNNTRAGS